MLLLVFFQKVILLKKWTDETWEKVWTLILLVIKKLLKLCLPYMFQGIDPAWIVIIGSKNVSAPGPGASAYSGGSQSRTLAQPREGFY